MQAIKRSGRLMKSQHYAFDTDDGLTTSVLRVASSETSDNETSLWSFSHNL